MTRAPEVSPFIFGAAYYPEYLDTDRIDTDFSLMRKAGMNTVRIAESTWATCEPQPGTFDFSFVDRVCEAAQRHGISVIIGTPTYAVPVWMVKAHPDILARTTTVEHPHYGPRQIMDIVHPAYRFYAQRVIRALISHVANNPVVIGYQIDNETKHYDSVSPSMQQAFISDLQKRFHDDCEAMNRAFGLDYWSNRITSWSDFPDITGTINASLWGAFEEFRRRQVSEFLAWQAEIVREYAREDQFITHNFDFDWSLGWSSGIQPDVRHYEAAQCLDIAGTDIYHPSQDDLTGQEIALSGDMIRCLLPRQNYLVMETQAQGQIAWLPYPGQLRLQAYSHIASGAQGLMYWHWHSIHNSFESYWKGVLSHDLQPNRILKECAQFGEEIQKLQPSISGLKKKSNVAIVVDNASLSALERFPIATGFPVGESPSYNDVLRRIYQGFFRNNIECDVIDAQSVTSLDHYSLVVTPALYCIDDRLIHLLRNYVESGGHLMSFLRSFVANGDAKIFDESAPYYLTDVFGMTYDQITRPHHVQCVFSDVFPHHCGNAEGCIELLEADPDTHVLATWDTWPGYAAITRHTWGQGWAQWVGTMPSEDTIDQIVCEAADAAGINGWWRHMPDNVCVRRAYTSEGKEIVFLLHYAPSSINVDIPSCTVLCGNLSCPSTPTHASCTLSLQPWDVAIVMMEEGK